jgi:D-alanyl-D-alanine carboxypeptidase/D-alanyl-D-alanine-endopeptidase (penicillin-binding protein 4)
MRRAGKNSQNLFAECLLKRSGYEWARRRGIVDPQGSWKLGLDAAEHLVTSAGIDAKGLVIADGSGLSRENACTARQLVELLAWVQRRPFAPILMDNLSNGGVDGSLRKRLKDMPDRVFAKTGTMRGVRSLAGYVNSATGPRFAFAVIFNGYNGPSTPYKKIQDRFCRALVAAADREQAGSVQPTSSGP